MKKSVFTTVLLMTLALLVTSGCKSEFFNYDSTPGSTPAPKTEPKVTVKNQKSSDFDMIEQNRIPQMKPANDGKLLGYDYDKAGVSGYLNETERKYYDEFRSNSEKNKKSSVFSFF